MYFVKTGSSSILVPKAGGSDGLPPHHGLLVVRAKGTKLYVITGKHGGGKPCLLSLSQQHCILTQYNIIYSGSTMGSQVGMKNGVRGPL